VARTIEEARMLVEAVFEYIYDVEGVKHACVPLSTAEIISS